MKYALSRTLTDAQLNMAKAVLAFEATRITHGTKAAEDAWRASMEAFHSRPVDADMFPFQRYSREQRQYRHFGYSPL